MSDLIVVAYDDEFKAEEMRTKLRKMQRDYLIDLEDAVVAVKDAKSKVHLHQPISLPAFGAFQGGFWGLLVGLLFFSPLLGWAAGAATGAVTGALADIGINDDFMKKLAQTLKPGSSALFILVRKATPDKVLEEIRGTGGTVLQTSLSHEKEEKLKEALHAAKKEGSAAAV